MKMQLIFVKRGVIAISDGLRNNESDFELSLKFPYISQSSRYQTHGSDYFEFV